jgi:hypothetical protein
MEMLKLGKIKPGIKALLTTDYTDFTEKSV